jgi:hypothetical protein
MIAIPVRSRRAQKGQFAQKLQHAVPSIVVLGDGIEHLTHDPHGASLALGVAEVGVSVLVIGSVIRGFRHLRAQMAGTAQAHPHAHHGVDWIDLCLAAMLSVEAIAKYTANGRIPRPTIVLAFAMLVIGLAHGRIAAWGDRRRELRIDEAGIGLPGRFFRRHTLVWTGIASFDLTETAAVITTANGTMHRIDFSDVMRPAALRDALAQAHARHARAIMPPAAEASDA